jgi:hypothetical protein
MKTFKNEENLIFSTHTQTQHNYEKEKIVNDVFNK